MKRVLAILALIVVAISLWNFRTTPPPAPRISFGRTASAPFKQKVELQKVMKPEFRKTTAPEIFAHCDTFISTLTEMSVKDFMPMVSKGIDSSFNCFDSLNYDKNGIDLLLQSCRTTPEGKLKDENSCAASLMFFRAILIHRATEDDKDYRAMSLQLLLNKFVGLMMGPGEWDMKEAALREMGEALLEVEPNHPETYKVLSFIDVLDEKHEAIYEWSQRGLQLDPEDQDLKNLSYFAESHLPDFNPETFLDKYHHDEGARYITASYYWRNGKLEEARSALQELSTDVPGNQLYQNTYQASLKDQTGKDPIFELTVPLLNERW